MRKLDNKAVLVTGGAGFIGSHLVDALTHENVKEIIIVDNFFLGKRRNLLEAKQSFKKLEIIKHDATDYTFMRELISRKKVDVIFSLATKALPYSFTDADDAYFVNVNLANVLLRLLRDRLFKTLIHFSSSEAYGSSETTRMSESHPLQPTTPYAAGKASADLQLLAWQKFFDLDISIVRPFNTYGPRQNEGLYAGVIPITIKRILNNQKTILQGDGKQTRDFTYVTDIVKAAVSIYKKTSTKGKVVNIASGKEISIRTILRYIMEHLHYRRGIIRKPQRRSDVRRHRADIQLARSLIKYKPLVDLRTGLKKTINWYKENIQ